MYATSMMYDHCALCDSTRFESSFTSTKMCISMLGYIACPSGWIEYYTYFGCLLQKNEVELWYTDAASLMEITENILNK